jgi:peptidoglycan/LPS O-acetylase OafA/YrhL
VPLKPRPLIVAGALLLAAAMATRVHVALDKLLSDALFSTGFALLIASGFSSRFSNGFTQLAGRLTAAVGRRAYGLYLVHQPLLDWRLLPALARAPIALVCGWLFSDALERPFERASKRVR